MIYYNTFNYVDAYATYTAAFRNARGGTTTTGGEFIVREIIIIIVTRRDVVARERN